MVSRIAKILENVTLILILKFQEISRITLKKFSEIYCPHSHLDFREFLRFTLIKFSNPDAALVLENSRNLRMRMRILENPRTFYCVIVCKGIIRLGVVGALTIIEDIH